jgi:monoamine oxidase
LDSVDIVIVGAGIAGLAAAETLAREGHRVRLLEARDRIGGRIATRQDPGWPLPLEAGAEFMHGLSPPLERLRRQLGLSRHEVEQRHGEGTGQGPRGADRAWKAAMKLLDQLPRAGSDLSYARLRATQRWRKLAPARTQILATAFIEGFNAAPADAVSAVSLGQQTEAASATGGDRLFRLVGGYGGLVEALAERGQRAGVQLRLATMVRQVDWRPGRVLVQGESPLGVPLPPVRARAAIITLPIGVLGATARSPGGVRWSPALPADKRAALAGMCPGPVIRMLLRFRALPPELGPTGFTFLHANGQAVPTFWRAGGKDEPVLVGWAAGPAAIALARADDRARVRAALASLGHALGARRARQLGATLEAWRVFDWQIDPFARGAYSYLVPGALSAPAQLGRPLANTVFFAGEATHTAGASGTVHGALETGLRAAGEVLTALDPKRG